MAYADNVAILTGKYPQTLFYIMSAKLETLPDWISKNGLEVNAQKTKLVLFSRKYKCPPLVPKTKQAKALLQQ